LFSFALEDKKGLTTDKRILAEIAHGTSTFEEEAITAIQKKPE
jgi:hypothetical protein